MPWLAESDVPTLYLIVADDLDGFELLNFLCCIRTNLDKYDDNPNPDLFHCPTLREFFS